MSTVFILEGKRDNEPRTIIGVYSSRDLADRDRKRRVIEHHDEWHLIIEWIVDAA